MKFWPHVIVFWAQECVYGSRFIRPQLQRKTLLMIPAIAWWIIAANPQRFWGGLKLESWYRHFPTLHTAYCEGLSSLSTISQVPERDTAVAISMRALWLRLLLLFSWIALRSTSLSNSRSSSLQMHRPHVVLLLIPRGQNFPMRDYSSKQCRFLAISLYLLWLGLAPYHTIGVFSVVSPRAYKRKRRQCIWTHSLEAETL